MPSSTGARLSTRWLSAGRRAEACGAVLALLGWMTLWWPVLFAGERLHVRDLMRFALPSKQFLFDELAAGRLPLWTPWLGAGQPWLADLAHQALYPGNVAYLLPALLGAEPGTALDVFVLAHSLLALLGMRVLLGVLGCERLAAWTLALVYAASGVAVSLTDNVTYLAAAGWLPIALAALQRASLEPRALAAAALAVAMMLLAGDVLDVGMLMLFSPLLLPGWRAAAAHACRRVAVLGLVLLLAAGVAGAQLLPTLDLLGEGERIGGLPLAVAEVWSLPPQRLFELLAPFPFGAKYPLREVLLPSLYPAARTPWFESIYVGLLPVLLACCALLARRGGAWRWAIVLVLAVLLALGRHTPLYAWAHAWLALLDTQRYPEKLVLWVSLCVVVLAGLGVAPARVFLRRLRGADGRRDGLLRIAVSVALPLAVVAALVELPGAFLPAARLATLSAYWHTRTGVALSWLQGALLHALLVSLVLVLVVWIARRRPRAALRVLLLAAVLDLLWVHAGHTPGMPGDLLAAAPAPALLSRLQLPGDARLHVDTTPPDYVAAPPGEVDRRIRARYADELSAILAGAQWMRSTLLDRERLMPDGNVSVAVRLLGVGLAPLAPAIQTRRLAAVQAGDARLLAAAGVSTLIAPASRAPFWHAAGLRERFSETTSDVVVFEVPASRPWLSVSAGAVRSLQREPGHLRIEVSSPAGTRVVVRESWNRGWRVSLDHRAAVVPGLAEAGMLGLEVPAGRHLLEFRYRERALSPGIGLSLVSLLTVLWLWCGAPLPTRLRRGL